MAKILVIEDEKFISDLYAHVLIKSGFEVRTAGSAKDGIDILKSDKFDLLLLDILLPDMNGLEILRKWKEAFPKSPMIVILLTNLGQDAVIKEGFALGAHGYLIKSALTPEQIVNEVNNALTNDQSKSGV